MSGTPAHGPSIAGRSFTPQSVGRASTHGSPIRVSILEKERQEHFPVRGFDEQDRLSPEAKEQLEKRKDYDDYLNL